ncbi:MAG: hypothetical protein QNK37_19895 [Acidobacteriota bacterium]|nr:hypothetical protein [Acidobacteriota bacterium]
MAKNGWYLQKKGKFYGPFTADKVRGFKEAGKINDDTLVAADKSGKGAQPLSAVWENLDRADAPEPKKKSVDPPATKSAETTKEAREWLVVTTTREFGPYPFSHLRALVADGKLKAGDKVRKGDEDPIPVTDLLPELKAEPAAPKQAQAAKPAAPKPAAAKSRTAAPSDVPEREPRRPQPPAKPKKGRSLIASGVLAGVIILLGTFGYFLKKGAIDIPKDSITEKFVESSELHKRMRRSEIPPFNDLVQEALTVGLNFTSAQIRRYRATDFDIFARRKDLEPEDAKKLERAWWQQFFATRVQRVLRYQTNGSNYYTYLVGEDDLVFAVAIEGPTFHRQHLADYSTEDFAPNTRTAASRVGHDVWVADIADSIQARAYWKNEKKGSKLHFICVMNDPQLMGGG